MIEWEDDDQCACLLGKGKTEMLNLFTAVYMMITFFWDVMLCNLADRYRRFRVTHCLRISDRRLNSNDKCNIIP